MPLFQIEKPIALDRYDTLSDEELWKLINEGNRRLALAALYKKYYDLLYNYGIKCCADEELVKDCIQDIFVKIHLGKSLALNVTVRSYLLRCFHNTLMYNMNKKKHTDIFEENIQIPDPKDFFEDIYSLSDEDIRSIKLLREAVLSLPTNQKRILYLHYVRELSHKEIAEVLNISVQSSMNLKNRAITKLKFILSEKVFLLCLLECLRL